MLFKANMVGKNSIENGHHRSVRPAHMHETVSATVVVSLNKRPKTVARAAEYNYADLIIFFF